MCQSYPLFSTHTQLEMWHLESSPNILRKLNNWWAHLLEFAFHLSVQRSVVIPCELVSSDTAFFTLYNTVTPNGRGPVLVTGPFYARCSRMTSRGLDMQNTYFPVACKCTNNITSSIRTHSNESRTHLSAISGYFVLNVYDPWACSSTFLEQRDCSILLEWHDEFMSSELTTSTSPAAWAACSSKCPPLSSWEQTPRHCPHVWYYSICHWL